MTTTKTKTDGIQIESWSDALARGWSIKPLRLDGALRQTYRVRRRSHDFTGTEADLFGRISTIETEEEEQGGRRSAAERQRLQDEIDTLVTRMFRVGKRYVEAFGRHEKLDAQTREHREAGDFKSAHKLHPKSMSALDEATELLTAQTKILEQLAELPADALKANKRLMIFVKMMGKGKLDDAEAL